MIEISTTEGLLPMSDYKSKDKSTHLSPNEEAYFHAKNRDAINRMKNTRSHLRLVPNLPSADKLSAWQAPPGTARQVKKAA